MLLYILIKDVAHMALLEWHYKVLYNLDQCNKWILGTDIQYINGDMKTTLTYVSFFSEPIALGDKIWIVKLRYNGSVSLYSGCKHTLSEHDIFWKT